MTRTIKAHLLSSVLMIFLVACSGDNSTTINIEAPPNNGGGDSGGGLGVFVFVTFDDALRNSSALVSRFLDVKLNFLDRSLVDIRAIIPNFV